MKKISPPSAKKIFSSMDRILDMIGPQMQDTIRSVFFLLIFWLCVGGAVYGVTHGRDSAKIKSAPIVDNTNEAFELDMKRERRSGNFHGMLESEAMNELKNIDVTKERLPSRADLEPEVDRGIIEPETHRTSRPTGEVQAQEPIYEGDSGMRPRISSDVRPIPKKPDIFGDDTGAVVQGEKKELGPLEDATGKNRRDAERTERRPLEKAGERGSDIRKAAPLHHEEGLVE